ncbi:MAG: hypothetical protein JNL01_06965 [Bdellovibrionales bacterium]|nr:hypothetical protein [Bdellovibrionales bacterium]
MNTWDEMVLEASQSIEAELAIEREKNQKLARELTRTQFEKDVLIQQVEDLQERLARAPVPVNPVQIKNEIQQDLKQELTNEVTVLKTQLADLNELLVKRLKAVKQAPTQEKIGITGPEIQAQMEKFVTASEERSKSKEESKIYRDYLEQLKRAERLEALIEDNLYVKKAREELARERLKFREIASALHREVEYLKQIYPIRGLLKAKTLEIERVRKALARLPGNHPERIAISRIIEDHQDERRNIEKMLFEMESRLEKQCEQIQSVIDKNASLIAQGVPENQPVLVNGPTSDDSVTAVYADAEEPAPLSIAERMMGLSPRSSRLGQTIN